MNVIGAFHSSFIQGRRVRVLATHLASLIPANVSVLDVGCGDGWLAAEVGRRRPDLQISGIDVLLRSKTHVPVRQFDGTTVPLGEHSVDVVMMVDVLHHTLDPLVLLREARRVARTAVLLKDHVTRGVLARQTLRLMDWVGNARHGVALPYNYWTANQWHHAIQELGLLPSVWLSDLDLYPWPLHWLFDRSLHFIALLTIP